MDSFRKIPRSGHLIRASLAVILLAVLGTSASAQRSRADALNLYFSTHNNSFDEVVLAPSSSVSPSDTVEFAMFGDPISVTQDSWLIYVDLAADEDFSHPTQVFQVPVTKGDDTITMHNGTAWLLINGASFYSDTNDLETHSDHVSGSVPSVGCTSDTGGLPKGSGVGNTWGIIVNGSKDKRHKGANPRHLMEAHPEVSEWVKLGVEGDPVTIPCKQDICDAIDELAMMHCDKVYFIFTGHGSFKNCGMHLDNGKNGGCGEILTGEELACKLDDLDTDALCIILNCCFAEKFLDDMCEKLRASGIPSDGIGATCANKTAKACKCYSLFARYYHECIDNPTPGKTLKECIDCKLAAAQGPARNKPKCYRPGSCRPRRSKHPQESKFMDWGIWDANQQYGDDGLAYVGFDSGASGGYWRIGNPAGPSEWFSVDFDNCLQSMTIASLGVSLHNSNQFGQFATLGIYGDNLTIDPSGATPDVSGAQTFVETGHQFVQGASCTMQTYTVPLLHLDEYTNTHLAVQFSPSDSSLWICSDTGAAPSGRSYFSSSGYSSPAQSFSTNWMMRVGVVPESASSGKFLVNGQVATSVEQQDNVTFTFYGPQPGVLSAVFTAPPLPVAKVSPILPTGFGGPLPSSWTISALMDCNSPLDTPVSFNVIYLDPGSGSLKASNSVSLTVNASPSGCGLCFGQKDDGNWDGMIFKVQQPSGTQDWFSVKHGTPSASSGVNSLTGVEIATWDLCGDGRTFSEVGIYPANLSLSSAGNIPDLHSPIAVVRDSEAPPDPGAADWGYPAAFYNTLDVPVDSSTIYHAAVQWQSNDSCIWICADSTATGPDPCAVLPNSTSYSTSSGFAGWNAVTARNWMIKIDWQ